MWAFDLIELDGDDLRLDPLETRKCTLATLLLRAGAGLRWNEHIEEEDGSLVFHHACKLGLEGRAGQSPSSNPQTGNAQQRSLLNALMRHTAVTCFPSMRVGGRLLCRALT